MGIDDFVPVDDSVMGIGKVFTETSHVALYGLLSVNVANKVYFFIYLHKIL